MPPGAPPPTELSNDARYYTGRVDPVGELVDLGVGEAVVFTCPSPLHPDRNEDGAAVYRVADAALIGVADGVGGLPAGESASTAALEALGDALADLPDDLPEQTLRNAVLDGFEAAHAVIRSSPSGGATTLVVVEIRRGHLRTYNAGDSAILVVGADGEVKLQTVAQSPVGYALESGLFDEREALAHESRNVIFNCLGLDRLHVDLSTPTPIAPGDTVLVGTDGLFDNLTQDELVRTVAREPLPAVCEALARIARERMLALGGEHPSKPDDLTFAAFRLRG